MAEPLRMISLNCEGDKHWPRIFPFFEEFQADVICLQEVFEEDFEMLKKKYQMDGLFAPSATVTSPNRYELSLRGRWGEAILTKLPIEDANYAYYKGSGDHIPEFIDGNPSSVNRVLVTLHLDKDGLNYIVATTHFTWSDQGQTTPEQERDLKGLLKLLEKTPEVILCGDFNAPRGREIFSHLSRVFTDNIPPEVTSTLDPELHRVGQKQLVIDVLFTSPAYNVEKAEVVCGVSDHCAVKAKIIKVGEE